MNDLSYLMDHMEEEKDQTVVRELHLTNSMSNLYNNTANLIGSFTEQPNPNLSNVSNINQSAELTLNGSIIPSHLKNELGQKDFQQTKSGEKLPQEGPNIFQLLKKEDEPKKRRHKRKRESEVREKEAEFPTMTKVLKSLDDEDKTYFMNK